MAHFIRTIAALGHFFASMLLLFLIPACSSIETVAPERLFSGVLVDKDTGEGMSRLEVRLFWLKPKLITMGAWEPVAVTTTDAEGAFAFKVHGTETKPPKTSDQAEDVRSGLLTEKRKSEFTNVVNCQFAVKVHH